jgi:alkanesulfonate monooxygenase SsuD/methylene tetrahydromethanopterin reductase-like flavin-dependent oxidoreductase (luciferase family)
MHAAWERTAGADELRRIALVADELRYHHLTCSEHVATPVDLAKVRGGRYYDPLATLGFIAAITTRVKLVVHVAVSPYHHPLALAKQYGALDRLSAGRAVLGIGVDSLREDLVGWSHPALAAARIATR